MNFIKRTILEDFRKCRAAYVTLGDLVHEKLRQIVKDCGIGEIFGIEHRVKTEKSLAGKLERNGDRYTDLEELTDLLGARVICFFSDEVDLIGKGVEENFIIDRENSSDKRALIKADTFGYLSLHYICSVSEEMGYPPEVCGKKFEIQLRTNLQHTWAAINHDIGYKSEFGVPRVLARSFARLSGLLELADDEFVRARDGMRAYTSEIRERIAQGSADSVQIDMVSLGEYMRSNLAMRGFLDQLAAFSGAEISEIDPASYIEQLAFLGIRDLGGLRCLLEEERERALELARRALENSDIDILASNAALLYLCRARLLSGDYSEEEVVRFFALTNPDKGKAEKRARSFLRANARQTSEQKTLSPEEALYQRALALAELKHRGQTRIGGDAYITHPVAVAEIVKGWGYDIEYRIAALFHDLLEDTDATEEQIREIGGERVCEAVRRLTKKKPYVMEDYVANIRANGIARIVKAADRLHNLRCAIVADEEFKRRYILETLDYYMDFAAEIPPAVKALASSMEKKLSEHSFLYDSIDTWKQ